MSLKLTIPTALRKITGNEDVVEVQSGTVQEIIEQLDRSYSGFLSRVCEDDGKLRRFINIYVNVKTSAFWRICQRECRMARSFRSFWQSPAAKSKPSE